MHTCKKKKNFRKSKNRYIYNTYKSLKETYSLKIILIRLFNLNPELKNKNKKIIVLSAIFPDLNTMWFQNLNLFHVYI